MARERKRKRPVRCPYCSSQKYKTMRGRSSATPAQQANLQLVGKSRDWESYRAKVADWNAAHDDEMTLFTRQQWEREHEDPYSGFTRCCDQPVYRVAGGLYPTREDAPEMQILNRFIAHKRKLHELPDYDIPQRSRAWQQAIAAASLLLERCGENLQLALKVVDVGFSKENRWRKLAFVGELTSNRLFWQDKARAEKLLEIEDKEKDRERYSTSASTFTLAGQAAWQGPPALRAGASDGR